MSTHILVLGVVGCLKGFVVCVCLGLNWWGSVWFWLCDFGIDVVLGFCLVAPN